MNTIFDIDSFCSGGKRMSKEISKVLKRYVENSPVAREEIRSAVGVDRSTMSRHLNGKIPLTYQKIQSYAQVLGIHVHQLTGVEPIPLIGRTWNTEDMWRVKIFDSLTDTKKYIYPDIGYKKNYAAIMKSPDEQAPWLNNNILIFDANNMKKEVQQEDLERWSFVKYIADGEVRYKICIVYSLAFRPGQPRQYEIYMPHYSVQKREEKSVEVKFICPVKHWVQAVACSKWITKNVGEE